MSLSGVVIDKTTKKPIEGVHLAVENAYYEGGDFDSYNGYDNKLIVTNKNGRFKIVFKKSAFIVMKASKSGYQQNLHTQEVYSNNIDLTLSMMSTGIAK